MSKVIDKKKAIRCLAVTLANNDAGRNLAMNLISNMFDMNHRIALKEFDDAWKAKEIHKNLGGSLKNFENGLILTEKIDKNAELDKKNEAAEEVLDSIDKTVRCPECGSTNFTGADHNKSCNDCGNFFVDMEELELETTPKKQDTNSKEVK